METPNEIKKVMIIGPGPETIGQGSELGNAVAVACRVLRATGVKTIVVDCNLASPATDLVPGERAFIEPLNLTTVEHIVARERPDAILPIFGGRNAFDLIGGLEERGLFERNRLQTLGVTPEAVRRAERLVEIRQLLTGDALKTPSGG
ncbi:MAG TPA: hypothetical protein VEC37_18785, partial [Bacillota bacterium]|nr:hypothetical protein [Bacillota bacterium]